MHEGPAFRKLLNPSRPVTIFAAAAVAASFAGFSAPADATSGLDQSWMAPGHVLQFQAGTASDGTQGSYTFDVVVHAVDASTITFDFIAGAPPKIQQITYDRGTRTATNGAGHAWLFINQADIEAGGAFIGGEYAAMTPLSNVALVQFSTSSQNYHFDARTGLLVFAQDAGSGSSVNLIASAPGILTPPPDNEPAPTVTVTPAIVSAELVAGAAAEESEDASAAVIRFIRIPCSGTSSLKPLGVTQTCSGTFHVNGGFTIKSPEVWWPLLADGTISVTISDWIGTYYVAGCASVLPATSGNSVACSGGAVRSVVGGGEHTVNVRANFGHCLNPLTLFGCPWTWNTIIDGEITCGRNCHNRAI